MKNNKWQSELVARAAAAARRAYAPYSKFRVGAALLSADGHRILTGCNVENASFGLAICAERVALAAAVAAGFRRFKALAVCARGGKIAVPCGACLQTLAEFCQSDFIVLAAATARLDKISVYTLRDLLPYVFRFHS